MPHREGGGLAPLHRQGMGAIDALSPQQDELVLGPIRKARADCLAQGVPNMPGVAMCDRLLPLVAIGFVTALRIERDGLGSGFVDLDVTKG